MTDEQYRLYTYGLLNVPHGMGIIDFNDPHIKDELCNRHVNYMLSRTQQIFEYEGLPNTIPQRMLEMLLQVHGNVCITKVNGDLYAFFGGLGGEPDPYYMPTIYTVSNPALNYSANLEIGKECVWGRADNYGIGLLPLMRYYGTLRVESDITLRVGLINSRITRPISAEDDNTCKSALKYLEDIESGKLGVIADSPFFEGLNIANGLTGNEKLTDIVEVIQYLKASWYNDLGLNANFNMKRERVQNAETELNTDALIPLIDDMLNARQQMCEQVNEMYGTNISVKLSSVWDEVNQSLDTDQDGTGATDEESEKNTGNDTTIENPDNTNNDNGIPDNNEDPAKTDENAEPEPETEPEPEPTEPMEPDININIIVGDNNEITDDEGGEPENDNTDETLPDENSMDR